MDTAKGTPPGSRRITTCGISFFRKTVERALPVFTVPTVSQAPQMNGAAVITKEDGARKFSARPLPFSTPGHPFSTPPSFFLNPAYSAYSAVDAITHAPRGISIKRQRKAPRRTASSRLLVRTIMENTEVILWELQETTMPGLPRCGPPSWLSTASATAGRGRGPFLFT